MAYLVELAPYIVSALSVLSAWIVPCITARISQKFQREMKQYDSAENNVLDAYQKIDSFISALGKRTTTSYSDIGDADFGECYFAVYPLIDKSYWPKMNAFFERYSLSSIDPSDPDLYAIIEIVLQSKSTIKMPVIDGSKSPLSKNKKAFLCKKSNK